MSDILAVIGLVIVSGFGGFILGVDGMNKVWQDNCTKIGSHVSAGKVYECKQVTK